MKFQHYLKGIKIFYLCVIILTIILLIIFLFELSAFFRIYTDTRPRYSKSFLLICFMRDVTGKIEYLLKILINSLIIFFTARNFSTVYANIKKRLK